MDNWNRVAKRKLGVRVVYDLSATPFFLKGSDKAEGICSVGIERFLADGCD